MRRWITASAVLTLVLGAGIVAACKQSAGDRCEEESDCSSDLICNQATNTCQAPATGGTDGGFADASPPDASVDAGVPVPDATIDTTIDAPTLADAAVPDAPVPVH